MAKVTTPDGKYEYDPADPAQVEVIAALYAPTPEEKAEHLLAPVVTPEVKTASAPAAAKDGKN